MGTPMPSCSKFVAMPADWMLTSLASLSGWFCFVLAESTTQKPIQTPESVHLIEVIHPGISTVEPVECHLVERKSDDRSAHEFYLDVASVSCGDTQCRVDTLRLFWDQLGRYSRIELPNGVDLEKSQGQKFSKKDYDKLDATLSDANSPLREVYKDEIVGTVGGEGIDALSGATVILDKSAYVEGAVWTCYTLWHWVHGDIKIVIRNMSGDELTVSMLQGYLNSNDPDDQWFAMEQLTRRGVYTQQTIASVLATTEKNPDLTKAALAYWRQASDSIYAIGMMAQIEHSQGEYRWLCLNDIWLAKRDLPEECYDSLMADVSNYSYEDIHVLLKILKTQDELSPRAVNELLLLLYQEDFLIARVVYWLLSSQELNEAQAKKTKQFYDSWKDKL